MIRVHRINNSGKITPRNATDLDENRIRFNWGYHDAANDYQNKRERIDHATYNTILDIHFDSVYAWGYRYGWSDALNNQYINDSTAAWYQALTDNAITEGITDYNIENWKRLLKSKQN